MGQILTILGLILASNGLWDFLKTFVKSKRKRKNPQELMMLALGRDRLLHLCKKYIKLGYIPQDEYESFVELGDAYLKMHGNSIVKHLLDRAKKLPIKIESEE